MLSKFFYGEKLFEMFFALLKRKWGEGKLNNILGIHDREEFFAVFFVVCSLCT
jgi:hypothetical protein